MASKTSHKSSKHAKKPPSKRTSAASTRRPSRSAASPSPSRLIDQRIRDLADWRGKTLARLRALILDAHPDITEQWKWNNPVWEHGGIICTGEAYKNVVKLTFARGASIPDPSRLFNSSLAGNTRRAIDIHQDEAINEDAFISLVQAAVDRNAPALAANKAKPGAAKPGPVKLLSGGNPQIPKGEGDAPVQAYIAAMPGWKRDVGRRLDAIIARTVPRVRKAVKWNSPLYGVAGDHGQGWFLGIHCFAKYVKVAFFRGAALRPLPPGTSRQEHVRYLHIHEADTLDEAQLADWIEQASQLPGERM